MPMYDYRCPECGAESEDFCPIQLRDGPGERCSQCGAVTERVFSIHAPGTSLRAFDTPIEMYGCAPETPAQMADLRRRCPDIEYTELLVPIARTPQDKKDVLKACGFEDRSGRGG